MMKLRFVGLSLNALFFFAFLASSNAAGAQGIASKGEALYNTGDPARGVVPCMSCHGPNGNSAIAENPKLAGQSAAYIAKQLHDIKAGVRPSPVMSAMAAPLSNQDILDLATYLSAQTAQSGTSQDAKAAALGKQIYRGGIASKNIPACAACHGAAGAGIPAQYPRLAGQNMAYTQAQLVAFRSGTRTHPQMSGVAALLSDKEISALADYLAGLK